MSQYTQLTNNLDELNLIEMKNNLSTYLDLINEGKKTPVEALLDLTNYEIKRKEERAILSCVNVANFPYIKELNDFEFEYQPSINKKQIEDFLSLRFVDNNENIVFIGNSGVGKTHLATSIGIACAKHRKSTYFISCHDLINQLSTAHRENRLEKRIKHFVKYKVLIIDEIGYLPISKEEANLFFQLIAKRYEKRSTIITTNIQFSKWSETFNDPIIANAILDRLLHHSHIIKITGKSYRTKNKIEQLRTKGD